jgi:hypothetical protein
MFSDFPELATSLPLPVWREQPKRELRLATGRRHAQQAGRLHDLRLGVPLSVSPVATTPRFPGKSMVVTVSY